MGNQGFQLESTFYPGPIAGLSQENQMAPTLNSFVAPTGGAAAVATVLQEA